MIRTLVGILFCLPSSAMITAAPASLKAPKPLLDQVQCLSELLRDSHATWYPNATMVQIVEQRQGEALALVVFTVEGFGGGNNHTQYLAIFSADTHAKAQQHFMLIDVIPIAGKGWRSILDLRAKVIETLNGSETSIVIDAFEVSGDDDPNFPSNKITINLLLQEGRLVEQ